MTFLLGIFRLGFMDVILSRALLRGFITAVVRLILSSAPRWSIHKIGLSA
jgi:MFS superfamily sulfate permease-like transporter